MNKAYSKDNPNIPLTRLSELGELLSRDLNRLRQIRVSRKEKTRIIDNPSDSVCEYEDECDECMSEGMPIGHCTQKTAPTLNGTHLS